MVYSSEERDTGKIWIDGKHIYSKSFASKEHISSQIVLDSVITNSYVDTMVSITGTVRTNNDTSILPMPVDQSRSAGTYYIARVSVEGSSGLMFMPNIDTYGFSATVEYTKA